MYLISIFWGFSTPCHGSQFAARTRQEEEPDQSVAEHKGEMRREAVGEDLHIGRIAGEEEQPRGLAGAEVRDRYWQRRRKKDEREEEHQLHERNRDSIEREREVLREQRAEEAGRLDAEHDRIVERPRCEESPGDRAESAAGNPCADAIALSYSREKNDYRGEQKPCDHVRNPQDMNDLRLGRRARAIKDDTERREKKQLVDLQQGDEENRAQHFEERHTGLAMHVPGDAALPEIGIDQRQHVHARADRDDVAKAQRRVEAAHHPGQAERIDHPVEGGEGQEYAGELQHRGLLERRADLGNRDAPEDQREDEQRPEVRERLFPERCGARRWRGCARGRRQSASGIAIVMRGSLPTARVVWPLPVRSSARMPSPGPNRCIEPSPRPISTPPCSVITNWRRGALCQSMKAPGWTRLKTTPWAFCIGACSPIPPGAKGILSSSRCDCPSVPVYRRWIRIGMASLWVRYWGGIARSFRVGKCIGGGQGRQPAPLSYAAKPDTIFVVARSKKIAERKRSVRARVRGSSLDLLDPVPLSDGDEVLVTISQAVPAADMDAMRRAAGSWKGMVDADALIANIYADRLVATRPSPRV